METAGIDCGSTLIKAYWRKGGEDCFATTGGSASLGDLVREMCEDDVRKVRLTGIDGNGMTEVIAKRFAVIRADAGAVDDEIRLQAAGTRRLMGPQAPKKMLIASIGTGVSYTKVSGRNAKRSPLGSCHGGGTMLGLGRIVGARSFKELQLAAANGTPADLLVRDKLPETGGTPIGELVIAHFWKEDACFEDRCASIFNFAACSIIKDLAVLTSIPLSPKDIAVVGTVSESPLFKGYLMRWAPMLKGCRLHFPAHGGYAAAVGAWADIST